MLQYKGIQLSGPVEQKNKEKTILKKTLGVETSDNQEETIKLHLYRRSKSQDDHFKRKEKTFASSSKLSLGLSPYRPFTVVYRRWCFRLLISI